MDITIDMILTEPSAQLRDHMGNLAEHYSREYPLFRLGAGFSRIKKEGLCQQWGFPGIVSYCRAECLVRPSGAHNFLSALYRRFLMRGITHEEMERFERLRYAPHCDKSKEYIMV